MTLGFFFILQAIIVTLLIIVVLAQQSSAGLGGLAGGNNQSQFFAGRPEANLLTRLTTLLTALFFISSLMFALVNNSFNSFETGRANPTVADPENTVQQIEIEQ